MLLFRACIASPLPRLTFSHQTSSCACERCTTVETVDDVYTECRLRCSKSTHFPGIHDRHARTCPPVRGLVTIRHERCHRNVIGVSSIVMTFRLYKQTFRRPYLPRRSTHTPHDTLY